MSAGQNDDGRFKMIYQTAYFSSASARLSDADVASILHDAQIKNARLKITGMLLLIDEIFFQVLEGDKETVEDLLTRIQKNPLHSGMIRVMRKEAEDRLFPGWSMGFEKLAHGSVGNSVGEMPFDIADLAASPAFAAMASRAPELVIFTRSLYKSRHMVGAPDLPAT